jgi:hypothetical protein
MTVARVVQYIYIDRSRPVWLPDGRDAQQLRLKDLWPLLQAVVPGLPPHVGKAEAMDLYESLVLQKAQELAGASWREPPPPELMKRAAKALAGKA